jgi:ribosomal protein S18 acetylase RimI-like enzyme
MNSYQPEFRRITTKDINKLQKLGRKIFSDSFAWGNTKENLDAYLDKAFSQQLLQEEINNPGSQFYWVMASDQHAGYYKINHGNAQTELREPSAVELERIYLLSEFQGKGLGKSIVMHIVEQAGNQGLSYVWLGVWEKNVGVIRFYENLGFVAFGQHDFMVGNDNQTDIMMRLDLYKDPDGGIG